MDKGSPPLYAQLKTQMVRLLSEQGKPNQRFFTDSQLTEMFGVSRTTVREAVRELVQEGYLYRVRGVGTFSASAKVTTPLDQLESYFKAWTRQGRSVSARVKAMKWAKCPHWAAQLLGLREGARTLFVHRIRSADGLPIASDYRYLPEDIGRYVSARHLRSMPIYQILAKQMPFDPPASARFIVEAAAASSQDARILRITEGAPVLVRTHVLVSRAARPMSAGRSVFRADLTKWSIDLPVESR
jgi:GntR family transcriptional regulator